jgi:hypothetical protein
MPYPSSVDPGYGILYFNVRDYGSVGDGFTDDSTAIQTCINASMDDSIIFFPPGTYVVGTVIQLPGKRSYLGTNNSTIKMKDGANLVAVVASQAWITNESTSGNPIIITNITIDANSSNNLSGHGIVLMNYNSIMRECTVQNCVNNGIMISSVNQSGSAISNTCVENRLESCKVSNCLGHGIYGRDINGKLIDGYIDSCIVSDATLDAIRIERSTGFFVSRNYCYDNQASGISLSNCYSTFVIDNKIDGYGQDVSGNDFISGIEITAIGPHPTIVSGNNIATTEPAANYHYRHLSITFGGLTETRCLVLGNIIQGGWDASPNNPSDPAFSQAIAYQVNSTQTGGGQPAYLIASHNHYRNTGNDIFLDSYITPSAVEHVGDVQLDRHLVSSSTLSGVPALAALTANGGSPPAPSAGNGDTTDMRGRVLFGSGTSPSSGAQVSVTFAKSYASTPVIVLTAGNQATAALNPYVDGPSLSTTGFNFGCATAPSASQAGNTYAVEYIVIG